MTDAEEMNMIAAQEARLHFTAFPNALGIAIGQTILTRAMTEGLGIAIDVQRHGQRLFHAATTGTNVDNGHWIDRKVRTVNRFGHASLYMGAMGRALGIDFEKTYQLPPHQFGFAGGGFPVILKNTGPIGSVTISGLPERDDHALVVWALERHLA